MEVSRVTISCCWSSSVGVKGSVEARISEGEEVTAKSRWWMVGTRWGASSIVCKKSSASAAMWRAAKGEMRWRADNRGEPSMTGGGSTVVTTTEEMLAVGL